MHRPTFRKFRLAMVSGTSKRLQVPKMQKANIRGACKLNFRLPPLQDKARFGSAFRDRPIIS
jgi:hypothetical protein